jgi:hypothetical protein
VCGRPDSIREKTLKFAEMKDRELGLPEVGRKPSAAGATGTVLLAMVKKPVELKVTSEEGIWKV